MERRKRNSIIVGFISLLILAVGCETVQDNGENVQMVTPDEMETLIKMDRTQLVDVRTVGEYDQAHIEGAQNLVLGKDFKDRYENLDKDKPVAVYCKKGGRSGKCAKILKEAGFKKVFDLKGGLSQWIYEGKEVSEE